MTWNEINQSINQSIVLNSSISEKHSPPTSLSSLAWSYRSEVGGGKRSVAESPTGNPSPMPIAIAPHASHARHDRSMARSISVARAKVGGRGSSLPSSRNFAPSCGRVADVFSFVLAKTYNGFLVDTYAKCSSPLIKIMVCWISSSNQLQEMQYV